MKVDTLYDSTFVNLIEAPTFVEKKGEKDLPVDITLFNSLFGIDHHASNKLRSQFELSFFDITSENPHRPIINHAYFKYIGEKWGILVGQTDDVFNPLSPPTLNSNGNLFNGGNVGFRRLQLRLVRQSSLVGTSLQFLNEFSVNRTINILGSTTRGEEISFPLVEYRFGVNAQFANRSFQVGFSTLYGKEREEIEIDSDTSAIPETTIIKANEWAVGIDLKIPFHEKVSMMSEFFYGANLDAFFGGIGQGVNPQTEATIGVFGGWTSLSFDFSDTTTVDIGTGVDNPNEVNLNAGDRGQNIASFANLIFTISEHYKVGFEYFLLRTQYVGEGTLMNHRGQFSFIYNF